MKKFMKQPSTSFGGKLAEQEAGGVGKGCAEAQNCLEFFFWIQRDSAGARRSFGRLPGERRGACEALLLVRDPDSDLARAGLRRIERAHHRKGFGGCGCGCNGS